jgi:hypothetical protein
MPCQGTVPKAMQRRLDRPRSSPSNRSLVPNWRHERIPRAGRATRCGESDGAMAFRRLPRLLEEHQRHHNATRQAGGACQQTLGGARAPLGGDFIPYGTLHAPDAALSVPRMRTFPLRVRALLSGGDPLSFLAGAVLQRTPSPSGFAQRGFP